MIKVDSALYGLTGQFWVGDNNTSAPEGTVKVKDAVPIAMQSAINAKPHCKAQIEAEVEKAYPNHKNDDRLMNGKGAPPDDATKAHLPNGDVGGSDKTAPGRVRKK